MAAPVSVLHVDDDEAFREMTATFLQRKASSFSVSTVGSPKAALEHLAENHVDCVVSDYDMPGMTGLELFEAVSEEHGELPFILFTGKGSEEVASEAIHLGVTDYLRKGGGEGCYTVLANRVRNAVEAYRAGQYERINTLIRRVNRRLVGAETVEEVERVVCETLTESEFYRFAWVGEPNPETGVVDPRTWADDAGDYLEEVTVRHDDTPRGSGPGGEAVRTGEIQLTRNTQTTGPFEPWREVAKRHGYRSLVVLPLFAGDDLHGILPIYAARPDAFDEEERKVLSELADTVGDALASAKNRRLLAERERLLRRTRDAVADADRSADERVRALLDVGREALGASDAVLVRVDGDEYRVEVVSAGGEGVASVREGDTRTLAATPCERVIRERERVTVENTAESPDVSWPGAAERGPGWYLGAPVHADGAVCFYGDTPRESFETWETALVDIVAQLVGAQRRDDAGTP